MKMKNFEPVLHICICLAGIWMTYTSASEEDFEGTVVYHHTRTVDAGENVEFRCSIPDVLPGDNIKYRKINVRYHTPDGGSLLTSVNEDITTDRRTLVSSLADNSRYTVSLVEEEGVSAVYVLKITDAQPEDMGNITCMHTASDGESKYREIFPFYVIGPATSLAAFVGEHSEERTELNPSMSPYHFNTSNYYKILVKIAYPSVLLQWHLTIGPEDNPDNVTLTDTCTPSGGIHSDQSRGPLVKANLTALYECGIRPKPSYNGHTLRALVEQPGDHEDLFVTTVMNVTFTPQVLGCESEVVAAPVGSQSARLTCRVKANPPAVIEWHVTSRGGVVSEMSERFTAEVTTEGDIMTSTLTINEITEGDYDTYYVRAQNSNGYVRDASYTPSKQVQLVSEISAAVAVRMSFPCMLVIFVSCCVGH